MPSRKSLKGSMFWNLFQNAGHFGVQFIAMIVLARFLEPSDYALIGIINIFLALGNMFVDSGISGAIIYKKDANDTDFTTMFIFNMILSCSIYTIMFLFAPIISNFYEQEELTAVIRYTLLLVVINGFAIMPNTLLTKKLKFKCLAIIDIIASIFSLTLAVVFAYYGWGVWALVIQMLSQATVNTILLYLYTHYFPKLSYSKTSLKEQLSFGINTVFANMLRMISDNIFTNFIAKVEIATTTGYYVQANKFHSPFIGVVISVMDKSLFPIFSKMNNKRNELYEKVNLYTLLFVSSSIFITPLFLIISPVVIVLLLGERWFETSIYFNLLLITTPAYVLQSCVRNALKSIGNTQQILYNDMIRFTLVVVVILCLANTSIVKILYGVIFVQYLLAAILFYILSKKIIVNIYSSLKEWAIISVSSILPYLVTTIISVNNIYVLAVVSVIVYVSCSFLLCIIIKPKTFKTIHEIIKNKRQDERI